MASNENIGTLVIDTASTDNTVTGQFGNRYPDAETVDADGIISADFTSAETAETLTDLVLEFDAFDVDTATEVEVFLSNPTVDSTGTDPVSLGTLTIGVNDGLESYSLVITEEQQGGGDSNVITFRQMDDITWKWGVTNIQLSEVDMTLGDQDIGTLVIDTASTNNTVTGQFGNRYPDAGTVDADGIISADFTSAETLTDLTLEFDAFDVDTATEVEVFLSNPTVDPTGTDPVSLGTLTIGVNDGLSSYSLVITEEQQAAGDSNVITFRQMDNITWKWGVTNIQLSEVDMTLVVGGATETGEFGLGSVLDVFGPVGDLDGVVTASFTSAATNDLLMTLDTFDIDTGTEVEVFINDVSLGFLSGVDNDILVGDTITILAAQQSATELNVISFVQDDAGGTDTTWGVTNIELDTLF